MHLSHVGQLSISGIVDEDMFPCSASFLRIRTNIARGCTSAIIEVNSSAMILWGPPPENLHPGLSVSLASLATHSNDMSHLSKNQITPLHNRLIFAQGLTKPGEYRSVGT